jgi:hypothetical protein
MEYQKHSDITQADNAKWEAQYGKHCISDLSVEIDGNYVVRKPDRTVLKAIGSHAQKNDVDKVNDVLIKNCVLGGDMEALDKDGQVYLEVLETINLLKTKAKSTIKKR